MFCNVDITVDNHEYIFGILYVPYNKTNWYDIVLSTSQAVPVFSGPYMGLLTQPSRCTTAFPTIPAFPVFPWTLATLEVSPICLLQRDPCLTSCPVLTTNRHLICTLVNTHTTTTIHITKKWSTNLWCTLLSCQSCWGEFRAEFQMTTTTTAAAAAAAAAAQTYARSNTTYQLGYNC